MYKRQDERKGEQHVLRLQPDATALDQVVVTATRTPKALKDAPVSYTHLDVYKRQATDGGITFGGGEPLLY